MAGSEPVLEVSRGRLVESIHFGSIAVVDSSGKLISGNGDPQMVSFLRSSAKPFQVLPFVERGGVEHFKYTACELALSCASHEGARIHLDTVKEMQAKVGITENDLQCGGHQRRGRKRTISCIAQRNEFGLGYPFVCVDVVNSPIGNRRLPRGGSTTRCIVVSNEEACFRGQ